MTKVIAKIKAGDKVYILKGKDNGKTGIVEKVLAEEQKVIVRGVNLVKKHVKPRGRQQGGIITMEKAVALANVQMICPSCNKRTRIAYKMIGKDKQRVCKKCDKIIEKANPPAGGRTARSSKKTKK